MLLTTLYENILDQVIEQWENRELDYPLTTPAYEYISWDTTYELTDIYTDAVLSVLRLWKIKQKDPSVYIEDWNDNSSVARDYIPFS